ncbi:MAG: sugar transferase [Patescibacteria group bacterium]
MDSVNRINQITLLLGDVLILYVSLLLTLFIRYGGISGKILSSHLIPFTFVFMVWLIIWYITGLYDLRILKNDINFAKKIISAILVNGLLAIVIFYFFIPAFVITPRANLFIFILIFGLGAYIWRTYYNTILSAEPPKNKILLIGYNQVAEELAKHLQDNPQLGFEIKFWMKEGLQDKEFKHLAQIITENKINIITVPAHVKKSSKSAKLIYKNLALGIDIWDLSRLYELIFKKIPLAELEEVWFLENLSKTNELYELFNRALGIALAGILLILLSPIILIIAFLVAVSSRGPVIFQQERLGKNGSPFTIYKFRTMRADAEKDGPKWASVDDNRSTAIGKILRKTHLDELPQLINILQGDLSFVGPRPERPEFVEQLKKEVPFYELRLLVKPGITGWAQINYKYGASIEETYEKIQYDLYYLKNKSLLFDFLILLRTVKYFFTTIK